MARTTTARPYKANLTGAAGLACAVFDLAARDLRRPRYATGARDFLRSPWAAQLLAGLCEAIGVDGYDGADLARIAGDLKSESSD